MTLFNEHADTDSAARTATERTLPPGGPSAASEAWEAVSPRWATRLGLVFLLAVSAGLARADHDRVMVGENILVAHDEKLHDVVCIGCSIRIEGEVDGDAVAIGGSVVVEGSVGDTVAIGGSIDASGTIRGDAVAIGSSVTLGGEILGDVVAVGGSVNLGPGAEIKGDAVSVMGAVNGLEQARVGGQVHVTKEVAPLAKAGMAFALVLFLLAGLIVQPFLVWICYLILGPRRIQVLAETARQRAGMSILVGMGTLVAWLMLSVVGAIIPFWIPGVGFPLSLVVFVLLVVGYSGISYWVGRGLLGRSGPLTAALVGAVLVTILQLVPLVGWLACAMFALMAVGSSLLSGFGTSVDWLVGRSEIEPVVDPVAH